MYEAARLLFKNIHNNAKLALCLVHLGQYREAVEAATKANAVNTWKQVKKDLAFPGMCVYVAAWLLQLFRPPSLNDKSG